MSNRKPISKSLRFDIFHRDGFTCQYCGQQPPEAVLEIDHVMPVVEGGTNDPLNLITACDNCNRGKGAKLLDHPQRPDADLEWLATQQEIAELRRYQEAVKEKTEIEGEIAKSFQDIWQEYSDLDWVPKKRVIREWINKFDPEIVEEAIKVTAPKVARGMLYSNKDYDWERYMWGTMWRMYGNK